MTNWFHAFWLALSSDLDRYVAAAAKRTHSNTEQALLNSPGIDSLNCLLPFKLMCAENSIGSGAPKPYGWPYGASSGQRSPCRNPQPRGACP